MSIDHDPTGRRARWALELDMYDWMIKHRQGLKHTNTDSLSNHPSHIDSEFQSTVGHIHSDKSNIADITAIITAHAVFDLSQMLSVNIAQCQKDDDTLSQQSSRYTGDSLRDFTCRMRESIVSPVINLRSHPLLILLSLVKLSGRYYHFYMVTLL